MRPEGTPDLGHAARLFSLRIVSKKSFYCASKISRQQTSAQLGLIKPAVPRSGRQRRLAALSAARAAIHTAPCRRRRAQCGLFLTSADNLNNSGVAI
jgi:hypothetical protein